MSEPVEYHSPIVLQSRQNLAPLLKGIRDDILTKKVDRNNDVPEQDLFNEERFFSLRPHAIRYACLNYRKNQNKIALNKDSAKFHRNAKITSSFYSSGDIVFEGVGSWWDKLGEEAKEIIEEESAYALKENDRFYIEFHADSKLKSLNVFKNQKDKTDGNRKLVSLMNHWNDIEKQNP